MTLRQERILRFCNLNGAGGGLEIGASFNPIAPKKSGFHIEVMDYMSREELLEKYKGQPAVPDNLEELIETVDYVWHGERYADFVKHSFDYIISSHLIEHVPDLIGHINDCCEILEDGGIYSLVVPDKRYSFDAMRKETTAQEAEERIGLTGYTDEMIIRYVTEVVKNGEAISWGKLCTEKDLKPVYSEEDMIRVKEDPKAYDLDIHASVFSPESFKAVMEELYRKKRIRMPLVYVDEDTEYGEFYAVFKKGVSPEEKDSFWKKEEETDKLLDGKCAIERMEAENGFLIVRGFSSVRGKQPVKTEVHIGKAVIPTVREMRPDLSDNINANKFGFFGMVPAASVKKGIRRVRIVSWDSAGREQKHRFILPVMKKGKTTRALAFLGKLKRKCGKALSRIRGKGRRTDR